MLCCFFKRRAFSQQLQHIQPRRFIDKDLRLLPAPASPSPKPPAARVTAARATDPAWKAARVTRADDGTSIVALISKLNTAQGIAQSTEMCSTMFIASDVFPIEAAPR